MARHKGNEALLPWLSAGLDPRPFLQASIVNHPTGRVVAMTISPARDRSVMFAGKGYARSGASKAELRLVPEKGRALWTRGSDWSAEIVEEASLSDLDPEALAKAREQFKVKHASQAEDVDGWDDLTFLNKARILRQGAITKSALRSHTSERHALSDRAHAVRYLGAP